MIDVIAAVSRVAFQIGPLPVYWYGIIISSAIIIAVVLASREARRIGLDAEFPYEIAFWAVPAAIIGARLYEVLVLQWGYFSQHPGEILSIRSGGLAIHGAIIAGVLTGWIVVRRRKADFWQWADVIAPVFVLAQAIGRWGNFFNQEAYGGPAPQWVLDLLPAFIREGMHIGGTYYHPTFLYESLWNLAAFAILVVWRRSNPPRGLIFWAWIALYNLGRFFIEGIRMDSSYWMGTIRVAQAVSAALFVVGLVGMWWRWRSAEKRYRDA